MTASKQTPATEINRRITEIHNLLIAGVRRADVIRHGEREGWNVSPRQIDHYIKKAKQELRESAIIDREEELGRAIRRLHHLYQASQRIADHKTSLAVQKELTALLGLAAAQKIEVESTVEVRSSAETAAWLKERIEEMATRSDGT